MKKKDVRIGETYLAKVSGALVPVKVLSETSTGSPHYRSAFRVVNTHTGQMLPKPRTAAALRPLRRSSSQRSGRAPARPSAWGPRPPVRFGGVDVSDLTHALFYGEGNPPFFHDYMPEMPPPEEHEDLHRLWSSVEAPYMRNPFRSRLSGGKVPVGSWTFDYYPHPPSAAKLGFLVRSAQERQGMDAERKKDHVVITGSAAQHSGLVRSLQGLGWPGEVVEHKLNPSIPGSIKDIYERDVQAGRDWLRYPWYVNFSEGARGRERRYSVPVPSLALARAWEQQYAMWPSKKRVSVTKRPSRNAQVLTPNLHKPEGNPRRRRSNPHLAIVG
jgi:hypothetical protein